MYTCVSVFREVCLTMSTSVCILMCAHAHTRVCGLAPGTGNGQMRPLSLEGSMVQHKEAWVKPASRKIKTLSLVLGPLLLALWFP